MDGWKSVCVIISNMNQCILDSLPSRALAGAVYPLPHPQHLHHIIKDFKDTQFNPVGISHLKSAVKNHLATYLKLGLENLLTA